MFVGKCCPGEEQKKEAKWLAAWCFMGGFGATQRGATRHLWGHPRWPCERGGTMEGCESFILLVLLLFNCKKGKFLYSAVSSPQDHSKRFTLYFPDRPVHSDTISASLGSIQPYAAINVRRLLVHISTTVYSQVLIYLAEWTGTM